MKSHFRENHGGYFIALVQFSIQYYTINEATCSSLNVFNSCGTWQRKIS